MGGVSICRVDSFPGRPFGMGVSSGVIRAVRDVQRRNMLIPTLIERGPANKCRVVSKRHEGVTDRLTKLRGVPYVMEGLDSSRTIVIVISDGLRERRVLPSRGTFTCGVGLSIVGERKREASLASSPLTAGLGKGHSSRLLNRRIKRDGSRVEECVQLACLVPRVLSVISGGGVTVHPTIRLSCLPGRRRRVLCSVVRSRTYAPDRTRTVGVHGFSTRNELGRSILLSVVSRRGPGRMRR